MAQICKVCSHPKTKEIEKDIINGLSHTKISKKYNVAYFSVRYHSEHHLPEKLVAAENRSEIQHTDGILQRVTRMLNESERILAEATDRGWHGTQLKAINQHNSSIELLAKLYVKMDEIRQREEQAEKAEDRADGFTEVMDRLTLSELKCLRFLQCKATAYVDDEDETESFTMRNYFQEFGNDPEKWPELKYVLGEKENKPRSVFDVEHTHQVQNSYKKTRATSDQPNKPKIKVKRKPTQQADDLELEDLELEDLELDDFDELDLKPLSNEIPSEKTDPDWFREQTRKNLGFR
ncbi:MAG: hypothetical protein WD267_11485 [Balneolales bacterium]